MILRLVQPLSFPRQHALRVEELRFHRRGEHLGEERTADEGSAHPRHLVGPERSREAGDEPTNQGWLDEEAFEIEPEIRVVARFEAEVAAPRGRQAQEVRDHPVNHVGSTTVVDSVTAL